MLLGLPEFELLSTDTVEETCALLGEYGDDTRVFAGGTDLFVKMKHRRAVPRRLINIKRIPNLGYIQRGKGGGLRIGALATIQAIEASSAIGKDFPSVKQAAGILGTKQIRNVGTLGGNLANASPSVEFGPSLLTLGASVKCAGRGRERTIPLEEFFVGPGKTTLARDELLTEVYVPEPPVGAQCIYLKHSLRRMDVAVASAAVLMVADGDLCTDVRIALGAVGPTPYRAKKAEQTLRRQRLSGERVERELLDEVGRVAAEECFPIDDFRGYAEYRRRLVRMLVSKGLERLVAGTRARTETPQ